MRRRPSTCSRTRSPGSARCSRVPAFVKAVKTFDDMFLGVGRVGKERWPRRASPPPGSRSRIAGKMDAEINAEAAAIQQSEDRCGAGARAEREERRRARPPRRPQRRGKRRSSGRCSSRGRRRRRSSYRAARMGEKELLEEDAARARAGARRSSLQQAAKTRKAADASARCRAREGDVLPSTEARDLPRSPDSSRTRSREATEKTDAAKATVDWSQQLEMSRTRSHHGRNADSALGKVAGGLAAGLAQASASRNPWNARAASEVVQGAEGAGGDRRPLRTIAGIRAQAGGLRGALGGGGPGARCWLRVRDLGRGHGAVGGAISGPLQEGPRQGGEEGTAGKILGKGISRELAESSCRNRSGRGRASPRSRRSGRPSRRRRPRTRSARTSRRGSVRPGAGSRRCSATWRGSRTRRSCKPRSPGSKRRLRKRSRSAASGSSPPAR